MLTRFIACVIFFLSHFSLTFGLSDLTKSGNVRSQCVVTAGNSTEIDDVPAILQALEECGNGGRVSFSNTTYHINSVMNTTWLDDVEIDIKGTLLVMKCNTARIIAASSLLTIVSSGAPILPTGSTIPWMLATRTSLQPGFLVDKTLSSTATDMAHLTVVDLCGTVTLLGCRIILVGRISLRSRRKIRYLRG